LSAFYELDGDTLKVCWAPWGSLEHPKEFSGTPGSAGDVAVLKRELKQ
jgi:hypothetical protein